MSDANNTLKEFRKRMQTLQDGSTMNDPTWAEHLGLGYTTYRNMMGKVKGRPGAKGPTLEILSQIASVLGPDAFMWLMTGEGDWSPWQYEEKDDYGPKERRGLYLVHPEYKTIVEESLPEYTEGDEIRPLVVVVSDVQGRQVIEGREEDYRGVPLYESGRLAAGRKGLFFDPREIPSSTVIVYRPELGHHARNNLAALRVGGDSMEPTVPEGSIVVMDMTDRAFKAGGIFVVNQPDGGESVAAVKRIDKWARGFTLISDNPRHPPIPVESDWPDLCVGRVIWMWRSMEGV